MKGNLMIRMMTFMVLLSIGLAHAFGQVNLWEVNWLWLAVFASLMGFQATFTGICPSNLIGKLSKTGECCPGGSCGTQAKAEATQQTNAAACCGGAATAQATETSGYCDNDNAGSEKTTYCGDRATDAKVVKVLGSGCANCQSTAKLIESVAEETKVTIELQKVEDFAEIAAYGVMSTPGVVVDEVVVHSGGIPSREQIKVWLS